jgi:DNA polymerase-3 subunit epsilon
MDYEQRATQLEANGDDRVQRRFAPAEPYAPLGGHDPQQRRGAMVIETEIPGTDRLIELGAVLAEFHPKRGHVHRVLERYSGLEDPGVPIPAALSGIADANLAGKRLDEARVEAALVRAHLMVAHHAPFDRGFPERRFPSFIDRGWASSQRAVPGQAMTTGSTEREWLASQLGGAVHAAHRARVDAEVLLLGLTGSGPEARTIRSHLRERSGRPIDPRPARVTIDPIPGRERDMNRHRSRRNCPSAPYPEHRLPS